MLEILEGRLVGLDRQRQCIIESLTACKSKIGVSLDLLVEIDQSIAFNCVIKY